MLSYHTLQLEQIEASRRVLVIEVTTTQQQQEKKYRIILDEIFFAYLGIASYFIEIM